MISETLQIIFSIIATFLGFPVGILIKKLTLGEQKSGRKYFKLLMLGSVLGLIISLIFVRENLLFISEALIFIILMTLPSLMKCKK